MKLYAYFRSSAAYPFRSAIAMLWPGGGAANAIGVFNLQAVSRETVQF